MERRIIWWWNGKWGRLARRDVSVWRDGDRLRVEIRTGGTEGRAMREAVPDETAAEHLVAKLVNEDGDTSWRAMEPNRRPPR